MVSVELQHVARPNLPWRTDRFPLCGEDGGHVSSLLSLADLDARIQRDGNASTAAITCRTCWDGRETARWESNPIGVIAREAVRAGIGSREPSARPEARRFANELRAIAALIEAHHGEFDGYRTALDATTNLTDHRRRKAPGAAESDWSSR